MRLFIVGLAGLLVAAPAWAATPKEKDVLAPVSTFAEAFNKGQQSYPEDVFTEDAVVVDGFAPFVWSGRNGAREWYGDLMGRTAQAHEAFMALHYHLRLGGPQISRVEGDKAYVVLPGVNHWRDKAGAHFEKANWAITLRHTDKGWRITSHSWAVVAAR